MGELSHTELVILCTSVTQVQEAKSSIWKEVTVGTANLSHPLQLFWSLLFKHQGLSLI